MLVSWSYVVSAQDEHKDCHGANSSVYELRQRGRQAKYDILAVEMDGPGIKWWLYKLVDEFNALLPFRDNSCYRAGTRVQCIKCARQYRDCCSQRLVISSPSHHTKTPAST